MRKIILSLFLLVFMISFTSAVLFDNYAYYKMDTGTGTILVDDFGGKYNGTFGGATWNNSGKINNGTQYVSASKQHINTTMNFTTGANTKSISLWFNWTGTGQQWIMSSGDNGTTGGAFGLYADGASLAFYGFSTGDMNFTNAGNIQKSVWNHVVLTYNGSLLKGYYNGVNTDNKTISLATGTRHNMTIGARLVGDGLTGYFDGRIDEIGTWTRELTNLDVTELYNGGLGLAFTSSAVVSLVTPANNSKQLSSNVPLTCSYSGNVASVNMSLLDNSTGVYKINMTKSLTGNTNSTTFYQNYTLGSSFLWSCLGANSTSSVSASENRTMTITGLLIKAVNYTTPVFENTIQTFTLNVTAESGVSVSGATLIYNGTSYSGSSTSYGNDIIFSKSISIGNFGSQANLSFYWNVLSSYSSDNSSTYTQTINTLDIDNCTTNTNQIINYTMYDEDTLTKLNATSQNTSSNIYVKLSSDFSGQVYNFYSNNSVGNPFKICISSALVTGSNYRLDSQVQFNSVNRVTEYHVLENVTINTSVAPLTYNLYDLASANSQEFLITFKDSNFIPVDNAIIEIQRQYLSLGQFIAVELTQTDSDGRTIGHFVLNDEVYNINVRKNNVLLATFSNVRVYCSGSDCRLNLNEVGSSVNPTDFKNYRGVSYTSTYNYTTRIYRFNYNSIDGSSRIFNLTILKADNYNNQTICSQQVTSFSGVLTCTIPSTINGTAIASVKVDGLGLYSQSFIIDSLISKGVSNIRFIFAFILILTLPLLVVSSGSMMLVFFIVGMIFAGLFAFIDFGGYVGGISSLVWFIVAIVVIIYKISKGSQDG